MDIAIKQDRLPGGFGLHWLLRLRWLSFAGQVVVCSASYWLLQLELPLAILGSCMAFTALTNVAVWFKRTDIEAYSHWVIPALIACDIVVLTIMLYFTGGAHNPFSTLYALLITIAAILLPAWAAWSAVGLCGLGFSLLFRSQHFLLDRDGVRCCDDLDFHLQGMWVSMVITGAAVAYFVTRLRADLERHRLQIANSRERDERQRRFSGLATLAAGVAHELATPLGTIAIISKDLERQACTVCKDSACKTDARLIREEVARCRAILDRLDERAAVDMQKLETLPLREITRRLPNLLDESHAQCIEWEIEPSEAIASIPVDPFLRSLAVLVKNSCEAAAAGPQVHITLKRTPEQLRISVRDNGTGIEPEIRARLGEPFYTTKAAGSGMGLGLFLVRTFVENMNGSLAIQSEPGSGTTVSIVLPQGKASE
jgi:two-component system sensor histidine kinase RegB